MRKFLCGVAVAALVASGAQAQPERGDRDDRNRADKAERGDDRREQERDRQNRDREQQRERQNRDREQRQRASDRQRDQRERSAERQRDQRQQAADRQREQAERSRERQRNAQREQRAVAERQRRAEDQRDRNADRRREAVQRQRRAEAQRSEQRRESIQRERRQDARERQLGERRRDLRQAQDQRERLAERRREQARDRQRDARRYADRRQRERNRARVVNQRGWDNYRVVSYNRGPIAGCPPGLRTRAGCMPPGQAKRLYERRYANYQPTYFGYDNVSDGRYRYDDGYLYNFDQGWDLASFIPLLGGALSIGNQWPQYYEPAPLPDYYVDYYNLGPSAGYRYADDVIYRVDPQSSSITSIAALLTGDQFAIGQPMPSGYDVYNVPYAYQDQYYDTPDANYRYADGYIYESDPTTGLIQAAIELLI